MAGTGHRSLPSTPSDTVTVTSATSARDVRVIRHLRSGLVVRITEAEGRTRVTVHGEIDLDCAGLLEQVLIHALRSAPDGLHLDLSGVGFFDCAGLNALLRVRALTAPDGPGLTVTSVSATVARVMDLTRTRAAFPSAAHARAQGLWQSLGRAHPA